MTEPSAHYRRVAEAWRRQARPAEGIESSPAGVVDLAAAESALGFTAPASYARFQLEFGNADDGPVTVYGVRPLGGELVRVNVEARREYGPALPVHLIAFSDNGGGDLVCFDASARIDGEYRVVWWDHERDASQRPEPAGDTFLHWLEAELAECANDPRLGRMSMLPGLYRSWMRSWFG